MPPVRACVALPNRPAGAISLDFTALVAGLRGGMGRAQQARFVERALARFLRVDAQETR